MRDLAVFFSYYFLRNWTQTTTLTTRQGWKSSPFPEQTKEKTMDNKDIKGLTRKDFIKSLKEDKNRASNFSIESENLLFDYSKNLIDAETMQKLLAVAENADLKEWIERMFSGDKINHTEDRAVLHTALRATDKPINEIDAVFEKMYDFVGKVHSGEKTGYSGKRITTIVNIGIGGSHLGAEMAVKALTPYILPDIIYHFIANIDPDSLSETLQSINHEETLFIIASKSFGTIETLTNATSIKKWFLNHNGVSAKDISSHFIAVSNNVEKAVAFGIDAENIFPMWDWVGGRYSVWSAVGISVALSIGIENFKQFLNGATKADNHFRNTPFSENIPVVMALLGILYRNYYNIGSHAVVPYSDNLELLVNYLQQTDMESNGKSIDRDGKTTAVQTGPVIWGGVGTSCQHAFFQHLHQGTEFTPVDFIVAVGSHSPELEHQQKLLLANCLAQSMALAIGKDRETVIAELKAAGMDESKIESLATYKTFKGGRPSNTLLLPKLTPENLGFLIATYEHKIFTQGIIWNINSFDQWGVELGKELADTILPTLEGNDNPNFDTSTNLLLQKIRDYS